MIIIIVNALNFKQKKKEIGFILLLSIPEKLKTIKQTDYYPDQKKKLKKQQSNWTNYCYLRLVFFFFLIASIPYQNLKKEE